MAHDFNNMLAAILGYAEMLMLELPRVGSHKSDLQEIVKAAERARDLTQQLLAFARKQTLELKPLDLNRIIGGLEKMLRRTLRENVAMSTHLSPHISAIEGDIGQVEQIILNLAINAQDAMPEGGTLLIETADVVLDELYVQTHEGATAGPHVMLTMSDTGMGMDEQTIRRIFDPFFTTKEMGRGTGLGLSTVYGIVKQHGGNITAHSEPGRGTKFQVYFPRSRKDPEAVEARMSGNGLQGSETILVVEDQEQVRAMACTMLKRFGYDVLEAADAESALQMEASHSGPIHLLVTDVVMPGMNGKELYDRLLEMGKGIKVLFMSGYTTNSIVHHGVLDEGVDFIQKPFSLADFMSKVRQVLEK